MEQQIWQTVHLINLTSNCKQKLFHFFILVFLYVKHTVLFLDDTRNKKKKYTNMPFTLSLFYWIIFPSSMSNSIWPCFENIISSSWRQSAIVQMFSSGQVFVLPCITVATPPRSTQCQIFMQKPMVHLKNFFTLIYKICGVTFFLLNFSLFVGCCFYYLLSSVLMWFLLSNFAVFLCLCKVLWIALCLNGAI